MPKWGLADEGFYPALSHKKVFLRGTAIAGQELGEIAAVAIEPLPDVDT